MASEKMIHEKSSKLNQAEAYWAAVPAKTEKNLKHVVEKFGLKFATVISAREQQDMGDKSYSDQRKQMGREMAILAATQDGGLGEADFFFRA